MYNITGLFVAGNRMLDRCTAEKICAVPISGASIVESVLFTSGSSGLRVFLLPSKRVQHSRVEHSLKSLSSIPGDP